MYTKELADLHGCFVGDEKISPYVDNGGVLKWDLPDYLFAVSPTHIETHTGETCDTLETHATVSAAGQPEGEEIRPLATPDFIHQAAPASASPPPQTKRNASLDAPSSDPVDERVRPVVIAPLQGGSTPSTARLAHHREQAAAPPSTPRVESEPATWTPSKVVSPGPAAQRLADPPSSDPQSPNFNLGFDQPSGAGQASHSRSVVGQKGLRSSSSTRLGLLPEHATPYQLPEIGGILDGKYRIIQKVGQGGFCVVFKAEHTLLKVPVAVKIARPEVIAQRPHLGERLCDEAMLAAQIEHNHIVKIRDVVSRSPLHYIVMEHIDGASLRRIIKRGKQLRPLTAVSIIHACVRGLEAALDRMGIIHCDLKPANIMVGRDKIPRIVDLGLARVHDPAGASTQHDGGRNGTPAYMAPEQFTSPEKVGFRADIYALGCTLFECITGHPPFAAASFTELQNKHLRQSPPPLPESVPSFVNDLVMKMMAKDHEQRYDDYASLSEHLLECRNALREQTAAIQHSS